MMRTGPIRTREAHLRQSVVIFDDTMDAKGYEEILQQLLLPFLKAYYPDGHCLMQDNDPKHTSKHIQEFFAKEEVNW